MVTLTKLIIGIITTLSVNSTNNYEPIKEKDELIALHVSNYTAKDSKTKAFQILENKCATFVTKNETKDVCSH